MLNQHKLLASGRSSDVFDLGDGCVLRKFKSGGDAEFEAAVMEHVRAAGYPVPRVHESRPGELVLDRIDGRTMLEDIYRCPWRAQRHARTLARLHERLHRIPAPEWLPACVETTQARAGDPAAVLHLDLHPGNVLLSARGPSVIDWTNARSGPAKLDVVLSWVIAATSGRLARAWGRLFVRAAGASSLCLDAGSATLAEAVELRLRDPNLDAAERARVRRLLD